MDGLIRRFQSVTFWKQVLQGVGGLVVINEVDKNALKPGIKMLANKVPWLGNWVDNIETAVTFAVGVSTYSAFGPQL